MENELNELNQETAVDIHDKEYLVEQFRQNRRMEIVFIKKNGDQRTMLCTRNIDELPEEMRKPITESSEEKPARPEPDHLFRVFDIDAKMWKSFVVDNLITIKPAA